MNNEDDDDCCSSGDFELEVAARPECNEVAPDDSEVGDEPAECAVCTDALFEPVRLPMCGHVFCRHCIGEVMRRSGSVADGSGARCPLCRQSLATISAQWLAAAPVEALLERELRVRYPETWERRHAEAELRHASCIPLVIGSRADTDVAGGSRLPATTLFVEVRPATSPAVANPAAGGMVAAMLIDSVRFTLAHRGGVDDVVTEVEVPPFELALRTLLRADECVALVEVVWKRRLRLSPMSFEHRFSHAASQNAQPIAQPSAEVTGGATRHGSSLHQISLPEGLTLARLLARTRPKARVGVGTALESHVY